MMRRFGRHERAFSLFEMVIGSWIALYMVLGAVGGLFSMAFLADMSRDSVVALNDANEVMEQVTATPFSEITRTDWALWAQNNCCTGLNEERAQVIPTPRDSELMEITVKMAWKTRNRPMSMQLVTLLTKN